MSRIYTFENTDASHGFRSSYINLYEGIANGEVADYVDQRFANHGGYFTDKNRGWDFTKSSVTSYIASDEANYDRTAILVISHFIERGRAFLPNSGIDTDRIRDSEIYPYASQEHFFTFLWVCNQAENREYTNGKVWPHYMGNAYNEGSGSYVPTNNRGSPIAWTGRDGFYSGGTWMNFDGYAYPDGSGQCYISFYGMSPMLSGIPSNTFMDISGSNCKNFIKQFYYYALDWHYSVGDSLNRASKDQFNDLDFVQCPLYLGYNTYWPGGDAFSPVWTAANGAAFGLCPSGKKFLNQSGYYPIDYFYLPSQNQPENCTSAPNEMRVHGDSNVRLDQAGDPLPTSGAWEDEFSTPNRSSRWNVLSNGGTASQPSGSLRVETWYNGDYYQGGYVTADSYNLLGGRTEVTLTSQQGELYEMNLQISTTNVTASDPFFEQNWYRINKLNNGNTVVQRRVNGQVSTMWQGYTGGNQLSITIGSNGIIQLSDGVYTYSEYCQISPQYNNFYIYLFTSSNVAGIGTFDNFRCWATAAPPPPSGSWGDEFNDESMGSWWNLKQDGGSAMKKMAFSMFTRAQVNGIRAGMLRQALTT